MTVLVSLISGLTMIAILVVVHEFGHFLFARLFRIGAPVFSIGMGKRLFGVQYKGTDFRVSLLPIGGYVQLLGVDPFGEEDAEANVLDDDQSFMSRPVWQRVVVMAAGPGFSLLFPVIVFALVFMWGQPRLDTAVGTVLPGTPAAEAGFQTGDVLVAVDGQPIEIWSEWVSHAEDVHPKGVSFDVQRDGAPVQLHLPAGAIGFGIDGAIDQNRIGLLHQIASTRVGVDNPESPAAKAGLLIGDLIRKVDGEEVTNWYQLHDALGATGTHDIELDRLVGDEIKPVSTTLVMTAWDRDRADPMVDVWGMVPIQVYIDRVKDDSAASAAGLLPNDRLYAVDGVRVRSWTEVTWLVAATVSHDGPNATPRELNLEIVREGTHMERRFTPTLERDVFNGEPRWRPLMGVYAYQAAWNMGDTVVKSYGPVMATSLALESSGKVIHRVFLTLGYLFTGHLTPKESVGGPVAIMQVAGQVAEAGFLPWVQTMAMISFSLGIVNLLPVPVLDGGQILFYSIEGIRGRPLSLAIRERVQMISVLGLAVVMVLVLVMDISRLFETGG